MSDIVHSKYCIAAREKYKEALPAFEAQWPLYCRNCKARGGFVSYYDPSPAGVSLGPGRMAEFDPCEACDGYCPRCNAVMDEDFYDYELPCPKCGWQWGEADGDCAPQEPECYCWETYAREL